MTKRISLPKGMGIEIENNNGRKRRARAERDQVTEPMVIGFLTGFLQWNQAFQHERTFAYVHTQLIGSAAKFAQHVALNSVGIVPFQIIEVAKDQQGANYCITMTKTGGVTAVFRGTLAGLAKHNAEPEVPAARVRSAVIPHSIPPPPLLVCAAAG